MENKKKTNEFENLKETLNKFNSDTGLDTDLNSLNVYLKDELINLFNNRVLRCSK